MAPLLGRNSRNRTRRLLTRTTIDCRDPEDEIWSLVTPKYVPRVTFFTPSAKLNTWKRLPQFHFAELFSSQIFFEKSESPFRGGTNQDESSFHPPSEREIALDPVDHFFGK